MPARHVILTRYGLRAAGALKCAGRSLSCLRYRSHKLEGAAPAPPTTGLGGQPTASAVLGRGPGSSPLPFRAVAMPSRCNAIPAGQNQAGPVHV